MTLDLDQKCDVLVIAKRMDAYYDAIVVGAGFAGVRTAQLYILSTQEDLRGLRANI